MSEQDFFNEQDLLRRNPFFTTGDKRFARQNVAEDSTTAQNAEEVLMRANNPISNLFLLNLISKLGMNKLPPIGNFVSFERQRDRGKKLRELRQILTAKKMNNSRLRQDINNNSLLDKELDKLLDFEELQILFKN